MTLPGATAFVGASAMYGPVAGLLAAALFGLFGAVVGEAFQRVFYAHGDTHVDPPAAAIAISTFLIAVLVAAGVFGSVWVTPI